MKDYKERFIMFAFNEGSITKKTADKYLNFIEQIISERDKEIIEILENIPFEKEETTQNYKAFLALQKHYLLQTLNK